MPADRTNASQVFGAAKTIARRSIPMAKLFSAAALGAWMLLPARPALAGSDDTMQPQTMPVNSVGLSKDDPNYSASFKGFDASFDPRSASDEELAKYNLVRPRDPRLLNDWYEALSRPVVLVPKNAVMQLRYGRHGLDQPAQLPADNTDTFRSQPGRTVLQPPKKTKI